MVGHGAGVHGIWRTVEVQARRAAAVFARPVLAVKMMLESMDSAKDNGLRDLSRKPLFLLVGAAGFELAAPLASMRVCRRLGRFVALLLRTVQPEIRLDCPSPRMPALAATRLVRDARSRGPHRRDQRSAGADNDEEWEVEEVEEDDAQEGDKQEDEQKAEDEGAEEDDDDDADGEGGAAVPMLSASRALVSPVGPS